MRARRTYSALRSGYHDPMPTPMSSNGPLSSDQQQQLLVANMVAKKIVNGPVQLSGINAAILAIGFGISVLWAMMSLMIDVMSTHGPGGTSHTSFAANMLVDVSNIAIAVALGYLTWNEKRGRRMLGQYDPRGAEILRLNQYYIMAFVVIYCVWAVLSVNPNEYAELGGALGADFSKDIVKAAYVTYGGVAVITAAVQYIMAGIYSRASLRLSAYVAETPEWLISIQRSFSH